MRPITNSEQQVLDRLLVLDFEGVRELRKQAMHIQGVEPNCTCGCPSFTPFVDRSQAPPASGSRLLPVELQELGRPSGIEHTVICFLDDNGYIGNVECVYYDDAIAEWPPLDSSVVLLSDSDHNLTSALLPTGAQVRPGDASDYWGSLKQVDSEFSAVTQSGWAETFDSSGRLISRARPT
jgi:hypothetical protein